MRGLEPCHAQADPEESRQATHQRREQGIDLHSPPLSEALPIIIIIINGFEVMRKSFLLGRVRRALIIRREGVMVTESMLWWSIAYAVIIAKSSALWLL